MPKVYQLWTIALIVFVKASWGEILVTNSSDFDRNTASRETWLDGMLIGDAQYRIDFELSFTEGTNISGSTGDGDLVIQDTSSAGAVTITEDSALLGGSNPVGNFSASHNEEDSLVLDFSLTPVDYVALLEIDTLGANYTVTFTDGSTESFSTETTASNQDSAEFIGIYRNDQPKISSVAIDSVDGDGEWGIDNIEFGNIKTVYVDQSAKGINDGSSWEDAFTNLGEALTAAGNPNQFLVAEGVYYPDDHLPAADPRSSRFNLPRESHLVGGFPEGGGPRDPALYLTILSGDLDQDDLDSDGNGITESHEDIVGDNAYRVLNMSLSLTRPLISGITITGALANGPSGNNSRADAAGLSSSQQGLLIRDCQFVGNRADGAGAGASISSRDRQSITILDSQFSGNNAGSAIAGLSVFSPTVEIHNCHFHDNSLSGAEESLSAGIAFSIAGSDSFHTLPQSVKVTNSIIEDNHLAAGSTLTTSTAFISDFTECEIDRNIFRGNSTAEGDSDSVINFRGSEAVSISNSLFSGNRTPAVISGQGAFVGLTVLRLDATNTSFVQNDAHWLYRVRQSHTSITSILEIENCISTSPIGNIAGSSNVAIASSFIKDPDVSNRLDLDTDLQFVAPRPSNESPTTLGNYRLRPDSPLIDAGSDTLAVGKIDLAGLDRFQDVIPDNNSFVDIGAYEYDLSPLLPTPEITVTDFFLNPVNGRVVLTVASSGATSYVAQWNPGLEPSDWKNTTTGTLSTGSNSVVIQGDEYDWPQALQFFRVVAQ